MREDAFSILHDGVVRKIAGVCPGEISLSVECDYLRQRIPDAGDRFILVLKNVTTCFYDPDGSGNRKITDLKEIQNHQLEILSSEVKDGEILVYTGTGVLHLRFETIAIWLNGDTQILEEELESVAEAYWEEWSRRAGKPQGSHLI